MFIEEEANQQLLKVGPKHEQNKKNEHMIGKSQLYRLSTRKGMPKIAATAEEFCFLLVFSNKFK